MLPTTSPADVLAISPEALEIANCYLQCQNLEQTASDLDLPVHTVAEYLERREVKAYIDQVFYNVGFNNRFKLRALMDAVIAKKLEEMDEAGIGSTKDISELLQLSHKMTIEHMDKEIQLKKADQGKLRNQTNIQINDASGGGYNQLMQKLLQKNAGN